MKPTKGKYYWIYLDGVSINRKCIAETYSGGIFETYKDLFREREKELILGEAEEPVVPAEPKDNWIQSIVRKLFRIK